MHEDNEVGFFIDFPGSLAGDIINYSCGGAAPGCIPAKYAANCLIRQGHFGGAHHALEHPHLENEPRPIPILNRFDNPRSIFVSGQSEMTKSCEKVKCDRSISNQDQ
jgi:hypothetical protein